MPSIVWLRLRNWARAPPLPFRNAVVRRRFGGLELVHLQPFLTTEKVRGRTMMDVQRRPTDVVLEGLTLTSSLVNPWPIYVVALVMFKIFLGVSDSGQVV